MPNFNLKSLANFKNCHRIHLLLLLQ